MFSRHTAIAITLALFALGCGEEATDDEQTPAPSEVGQTSEALTESGIVLLDAAGAELIKLTPSSVGNLIDGDPTTIQGREDLYFNLTDILDNADYPVSWGTVFIVDGERLFDNGTFESIPELPGCESDRAQRDCLCDEIIDNNGAVPSGQCLEAPRVRRDELRTTAQPLSDKVCGTTEDLNDIEKLIYGIGCMIKSNDCSGNLYCQ